MQKGEVEGVIRGVLPTTSRTSVTLTGVPAERGPGVVQAAIDYCRSNDAPLSEIHLPDSVRGDLAARFGDLIFADSGSDDVLRFVFQPAADLSPPLTSAASSPA